MIQNKHQLKQTAWLKGTREFTLGTGSDLHVTIRDKSGLNEHHVDLRHLKAQPTHAAKTPWITWIVGAVFSAGASALILTGIFSGEYSDGKLLGWAFGVPTLCVAILIVRKAIVERYDWLIFHNRYSGSTEIALFYDKPNAQAFAGFVEQLQQRIGETDNEKVREVGASNPTLADQLQSLAELHRTGVLTPEEFEAAKKKILSDPASPPRASDIDFSN